ncbi:MAG: exo-alpha-sialidase [Clostridia bacterium]|nr:exo-alpha-sialidase [Clostridia bacterium]
MKALLLLMSILFLLSATSCGADSSASADISNIVFDDESITPALVPGGYARFEVLGDGTLMFFNDDILYKSCNHGESWNKKRISENAATVVTSATGKAHTLSLENWQGFVMDDGTVLVSYRARTKNYKSGEFYTSIRVMTSYDNAETFANEVIIAEATTDGFHGYWEPFMIQPDANTVLLFYSDDLNVNNIGPQQNIVYHEYDISAKTWSNAVVAVDGVKRNSRDGMPVITKLKDGGYAMVIETQDYHHRFRGLTFGKSVFVISISLSADGKTWSNPVPVVAPADITGGDRCAAPYITTLPDGRVIISYMTEDGFKGIRVNDEVLNCVYGAVISNDVITVDTRLSATTGGPAKGFTTLPDIFEDPINGYMVWNSVFCDGEYVYFSGGAGINDGSVTPTLRIRRADVRTLSDK